MLERIVPEAGVPERRQPELATPKPIMPEIAMPEPVMPEAVVESAAKTMVAQARPAGDDLHVKTAFRRRRLRQRSYRQHKPGSQTWQ
jgi:hypothetical protein